MDYSILEDLFNGKIMPFENLISENPEFLKINQKISGEKKYFKSILSAKDYERLEALETFYTASTHLETAAAFVRGFRIAMLMSSEIYYKSEDLKKIFRLLGIQDNETPEE